MSTRHLYGTKYEWKKILCFFSLNIYHLLGGALWKQSRKLMNPMFNLKTLQSFIPIFYKKTRNVVDELKDHVGKSGIDLLPYTAACSLDAILCMF